MTRKYSMLLAPILILLLSSSSNAFSILTTPTQRFSSNALKVGNNKGLVSSSPTTYLSFNGGRRNPVRRSFNEINNGAESQIRLSMYNLPPSPGGGGGKDDIVNIAKGASSIALVVGFFISPLGGLVLGLLNSFLVLIFVLPLIATVGFQVWQKVNTISGVCPNCGSPATVIKQKSSNNDVDTAIPQQTMCFNCGAVLQANSDNTEINNVSGRKNIDDLSSEGARGTSLFDILSGAYDRSGGDASGGVGGDTIASKSTATTVETSKSTATTVETTSTRASSSSGQTRKISKPMDVIDVDIEDEDKPFQ
jgi:hypothetical protein